MSFAVDFALVEAVGEAVSRHVRRTPLLRSDWLSVRTDREVFLKCENLQVTGSFKVRGALAALARLGAEERRRGVVAASAGNHGLGLAHAAAVHGVAATVVVPRSAPAVKVDGIAALGARVVRSPHDGYDDTETWTLENLGRLGGLWLSPCEDPAVIAGNGGTTAREIFADAPALDALVVPCGGGGCAIGAGVVARRMSPATRIVAVNTEASPGMWLSWQEGRARRRVASRPTVAEGLEGGVGEQAYALSRRYIDEVRLVSEAAIRRAVVGCLLRERLLVEGSGAAGVAALLDGHVEGRRIGVVLTGSNIDRSRLGELLARDPTERPEG
ncbi:MAG: pyridoxal-phosphate dependent enzyme [Planctomycetes bacterium]|nr:pyridoxal-phosphate dependent enzyme [Planctomycetota bacterium]